MSSEYEILVNNNHNILFEVDTIGDLTIDGLSLKNPNFDTIGLSSGAFNIDISGNMDVSGNVTIVGNLLVQGSKAEIFTEQKLIQDSLIELSSGATEPINDIGFVFNRGGDNACFFW